MCTHNFNTAPMFLLLVITMTLSLPCYDYSSHTPGCSETPANSDILLSVLHPHSSMSTKCFLAIGSASPCRRVIFASLKADEKKSDGVQNQLLTYIINV